MKNLSKTLLEMDAVEAKEFFMKNEHYFNVHLPLYIDFEPLLKQADQMLKTKNNQRQTLNNISNHKNISKHSVNYEIISNKDTNYSWRCFTIIHPILYLDLVNEITDPNNWKELLKKFEEFQKNSSIECLSIPRKSLREKQTDTARQVLDWWKNIEQRSIHYSLKYKYCMFTDIANCYPSMYTHGIAWAIMGKSQAKANRNYSDHWANRVDKKIQNLQEGQTNGIPQGSSLMDFIAEIVLGYNDLEISKRLNNFSNYKILCYRDDYRIFTKTKSDAELITKILSESLSDLGLQLNSSKTKLTSNIISNSIKPGKIYWQSKISSFRTILKIEKQNVYIFSLSPQQHLLEIKYFSEIFPNDGQLNKALNEFYKYHYPLMHHEPSDFYEILAIISDIMFCNPGTTSMSIAIISDLIKNLHPEEQNAIIKNIIDKYRTTPNTEYINIWLQRLSLAIGKDEHYNSKFCKLILEMSKSNITQKTNIFDSSWLNKNEKLIFDDSKFVNIDKLKNLKLPLDTKEYDYFDNWYD